MFFTKTSMSNVYKGYINYISTNHSVMQAKLMFSKFNCKNYLVFTFIQLYVTSNKKVA